MTATPRTVTVSGHGQVRVPRDVAVVRVSAVNRAAGLSDALSGAESARAQVVEIAARHVDAGAVSSEGLRSTRSTTMSAADVRRGQALAERALPDLTVAGRLVQLLVDEVGDRVRIDGVSLMATPTAEAARIARERAFDDARNRATHLAGLAGAGRVRCSRWPRAGPALRRAGCFSPPRQTSPSNPAPRRSRSASR